MLVSIIVFEIIVIIWHEKDRHRFEPRAIEVRNLLVTNCLEGLFVHITQDRPGAVEGPVFLPQVPPGKNTNETFADGR